MVSSSTPQPAESSDDEDDDDTGDVIPSRNTLHMAVLGGHSAIVKMVMDAAPVLASAADAAGFSPFLLAVVRGRLDTVQMLMGEEAAARWKAHLDGKGRMVNARWTIGPAPQTLATTQPPTPQAGARVTALALAALHGHTTLVSFLLVAGAIARAHTPSGNTALVRNNTHTRINARADPVTSFDRCSTWPCIACWSSNLAATLQC